jgi:uncharacterized protein (DUF169 family)
MTDVADRLKNILSMNLEPVGVRLFAKGEEIPPEVAALEPEQGVKSYCQGLTRAARGEVFFGGAAKLGCVLGTSTLGLEKSPEPLLDDAIMEKHGVGLFETEEASRASVHGAPKFEAGENQSVLIGPLTRLPLDPQLVVLEVDPEQTMWLLYGANYKSGGGQQLPQSGGVAGGCADVTTWPLFEGTVNVTFLGLGCRLKSSIPHDHLLFGLPWDRMEEIVGHLEKMSKPIAMLANARAGAN